VRRKTMMLQTNGARAARTPAQHWGLWSATKPVTGSDSSHRDEYRWQCRERISPGLLKALESASHSPVGLITYVQTQELQNKSVSAAIVLSS
jgi:hypothetical protein